MPIRQLLMRSQFSPAEARVLCAAYDGILARLALRRVPLPLAEALARKVIAVAEAGEHDVEQLIKRVLDEIGVLPHGRNGTKIRR